MASGVWFELGLGFSSKPISGRGGLYVGFWAVGHPRAVCRAWLAFLRPEGAGDWGGGRLRRVSMERSGLGLARGPILVDLCKGGIGCEVCIIRSHVHSETRIQNTRGTYGFRILQMMA